MSDLTDFRKQKDGFFAYHQQSPLTAEMKKNFKGLSYFPEAPDLRLEVQVEVYPDPETVEIQTSTGVTQAYQRFGKFRFEAEGKTQELTIFANHHGFFLPFVDSLAGKETYPSGRYLEPEPLGNGKFRIDFNLAYNPFCAYSDHWSCPLTPFENRLDVPIRAGEKIFKLEHKLGENE